jgi:quinol monooxygenase YgiN
MKHAVIGAIKVRPGARKEVLRSLLAHRERSLRDEPGTLGFEVLVPNDEADTILLFELYTDRLAFEAHFFHGASILQVKSEVGHLIESLTGTHCMLGSEVSESAA